MVPRYQLMTYDMEGLLKLSVERYLEIVGKDTKLKHVSTPSLPEETKKHQVKGTMFRGSQEEGILSLVFARI